MKKHEQSSQPAGVVASAGTSFSLSSMFLVTALACLCAAFYAAAPILGTIFIIFAVPALLRTIWYGKFHNAAGSTLNTIEKVVTFAQSFVVGVMMATAACGVFMAVSGPFLVARLILGKGTAPAPARQIVAGETLGVIGIVIGVAVGVGSLIYFIVRLWIPKK